MHILLPRISLPQNQQPQLQNAASARRGNPPFFPIQLPIDTFRPHTLTPSTQGGFSYVYLVQDTTTSTLYALKKIRCPFGRESVALALKEVEAYTLFTPHPNIIHAIDHSVTSAHDRADPAAKTVYILLPYYRRGNLQDAINANLVNHTKFPERRLMILFLGVARALKAMHDYRVKGAPGGASSQQKARAVRQEAAEADEDAKRKDKRRRKRRDDERGQQDADDEEHGEGVEHEPLMDGEVTLSQEGVGDGELRAYAHRDVKPGNIMIDDSGNSPILMDLGSMAPSPVAVVRPLIPFSPLPPHQPPKYPSTN